MSTITELEGTYTVIVTVDIPGRDKLVFSIPYQRYEHTSLDEDVRHALLDALISHERDDPASRDL